MGFPKQLGGLSRRGVPRSFAPGSTPPGPIVPGWGETLTPPLPSNDNTSGGGRPPRRGSFRWWGARAGELAFVLTALELYGRWRDYQPIQWGNMGPWSIYARCGAPDYIHYSVVGNSAWRTQSSSYGAVASLITGCQGLQGNPGHFWADPVPSNTKSIVYEPWGEYPSPGVYRGQVQIGFGRQTTGATTAPEPFKGPYYSDGLPVALPSLPAVPGEVIIPAEPMPLPIELLPGADPLPPFPPNGIRVQVGRLVRGFAGTIRGGVQIEWPIPELPGEGPITLPVPEVGPHYDKPAPPRTKERKGQVSLSVGRLFIGAIFNGVTETADVFDAAYDALPEKVREEKRKRYFDEKSGKWRKAHVSLRHKVRTVVDNWDKVDLSDFAVNLIKNQAEDAAFGRLGQLGVKANRYLHDQGYLSNIRNGGQPSRWAWDGPIVPTF